MLTDVLVEHREEAEILVERRSAALRSASWTLASLGALENRLDAHLGGSRLGLEAHVGALDRPELPRDAAAGFVWAATRLGARGGSPTAETLDAVNSVSSAALRGIIEALGYVDLSPCVRDVLDAWLSQGSERRVCVALDVLSLHHILQTPDLSPFLHASCGATRSVSARAAARLGRAEHGAVLEALTNDSEPSVREAAAWAGVRLGLPWSRPRLRELVEVCDRTSPELLFLLACVGDPSDLDRVTAGLDHPSLEEVAIGALGTLGLVCAVPMLIARMGTRRSARAAGAAFRRVTGLDPGSGSPGGASESDDAADFEDLRPVPDPEHALQIWRAQGARFRPDLRYREGQALDADAWRCDPHQGDLRTRREELTRLWHALPHALAGLELDAPAARQRRQAAGEAIG